MKLYVLNEGILRVTTWVAPESQVALVALVVPPKQRVPVAPIVIVRPVPAPGPVILDASTLKTPLVMFNSALSMALIVTAEPIFMTVAEELMVNL